MRKLIVLTLAAAVGGCSRHLYSSAAAPVTAPTPVVLAGSTGPIASRATVSSADAVDYLLARGMQIPVAGVSVSQLRDSFDEGRDGGRVHRALDIMASRGTPVIAADSGRILRLGFNALGGNCLYATDPLGRIVYYYAHLDAFQPGLAQGAALARGDTIGFVGTTGNAPKDTPHLHFQVMRMAPDGRFWDGEPINPYPLFLVTQDGNR
ncbi:MAG TPA: peptidoglycan DD-metalloendopeptidase family protein [Gemmatimonadaceae bacterium]